jgi:hypothetical protein
VPAFPILAATVIGRQPESSDQVAFVGDAPRSHDDRRNRVVDDLPQGSCGDTVPDPAPAQLSQEFWPTAM